MSRGNQAFALVLVFAISVGAAACSTVAGPSAEDDTSFAGDWRGYTIGTCGQSTAGPMARCNTTARITLKLVQKGTVVSGFYACDTDAEQCPGENKSAEVTNGSVDGEVFSLTIGPPGGAVCTFSGVANDIGLVGGYSCSSSGTVTETGRWRAVRG